MAYDPFLPKISDKFTEKIPTFGEGSSRLGQIHNFYQKFDSGAPLSLTVKKSFFDDFPYPPLAAPLPLPLGAPLPPLPLPFGPLLALMISSRPMSILSAILLIDLWFWNCKRFNRKHIWTIAHVSRLHEIAFHWNVCPAVLLCSLLVRFLKQNE